MAKLIQVLTNRLMLDRLAAAFTIVVCLGIAAYGCFRPDYNWDMVAYVASALESRAPDPQTLHDRTWAIIDAETSAAQQATLKHGTPYNEHQWNNAGDFESQLSMYRVKAGYVALIKSLEPVSGLADGVILLSVLPSLVIGGLLVWWLAREGALQAGFLIIPVLVSAGFIHMTTAATPDLLVSAVSLAAIFCLHRRLDWLGCMLLVASVVIRPDNLILVFALLIGAAAFGWRLPPFASAFVAAFIACVGMSKLGHHPGWWAHFYFSTVETQNSMTNFHPAFDLKAMARGYGRGAVFALTQNLWPWLVMLLVAVWALLARAGMTGAGRENALIFAMAIGTLGKFASFPLPDDRFYFVYIAAMSILLALMAKPGLTMQTRKTSTARPR